MKDQIIARAAEAAFGRPLVTNVLRSMLVEAIVEAALDKEWKWCAADYAGWDFVHSDSTKLEVKQSAALQSWAKEGSRPTRSTFDIAPRTGSWVNGDRWVPGVRRYADIYVLAHHSVSDATADHREPKQWSFYVVPTTALPEGRSISLSRVQGIATAVPFGMLGKEVERVRIEVVELDA
jgi:hypothetical protein